MTENNPKDNQGCAFGKITRERVDNFIKIFEEFRDNDFKHLAEKVDRIGHRPSWAVSAIIWILSSTTVGLIVRASILGG